MKYIIVDGMLSGTGIRDADTREYILLDELGIDETIASRIQQWLSQYERAHYTEYSDCDVIKSLDQEGLAIARLLQDVLAECNVLYYYSDALLERIDL